MSSTARRDRPGRRKVALPVLPSASPRVRHSKVSRWRAAVLVGVHLLVAAHVAHWLLAGETLTPLEPSEAMELGRNGIVNAGALFFLAAIAATALFGRFFCGWGCHLVALQDLCRWLLEKVGIRPKPLRSRLLLWVPLIAFGYMFLWPFAYRLAVGLGPPALTRHFVTADFYATFPGPGVAVATFLVCGFVCVYLLGAKGFCTYACPYGAIFGLADRVAPMRIRVTEDCNHCGHCTSVCTSNVRVHEEVRDYGAVVDPGCMKCLDCVSVCPNDALYVGWGRPSLATPARAQPPEHRRLPWREEVVLAVAFVLAFFAFRGLYGLFPFLFSLGLAACLAFAALVGYRLATQENVAVRRLALKRGRSISRAGWATVALLGLVSLGWAHSAVAQVERRLALAAERRATAFARASPGTGSPALDREALDRLDRARRWGLRPQAELAPAATRLAARFAAAGDLAAAERAFEVAIDSGGATPSLLFDRGLARAHRGELAGAERDLRSALALDPDSVPARETLGGVLAMAGRFAEAAEELRAAVARHPDDAETRFLLARALAESGDLAAARREASLALQLDPNLEPAREMLRNISDQNIR